VIDEPFCPAHGNNKGREVRIRRNGHFGLCNPNPDSLGRSARTWIDVFKLAESDSSSFGLAVYPSETGQNRMRVNAISYFWVSLVNGSSTFESSNSKLCR
jgi:hypothetical protein